MQPKPDEATLSRAKLFLYKSVIENRLDLIQKIVSAQFPIEDEIGPGGLTLLMHCAQCGSVQCLEILLGLGAQVNARDNNLRTALHYACAAGREEMVKTLILIPGINYEAATRGGETPLMCAIESGSCQTLKECLVNGLCPFSFNNFLMTPLDYAKKFQNAESEDFVLLISKA